jgi:hypothetical protein
VKQGGQQSSTFGSKLVPDKGVFLEVACSSYEAANTTFPLGGLHFQICDKVIRCLAPPDTHYSRRNARRRFRHGRQAFVVLFVVCALNYGAYDS